MRNNVLEVIGRAELVGACEQTLTNRQLDLVVVRNCVTVVELDEIQKLAGDSAGSARLRDILPEVDEIDALVEGYWRGEGYSDYTIDPKLRPSNFKAADDSSSAHVDHPKLRHGSYAGMAVGLSISAAGGPPGAAAVYRAKRPKKSYKATDGYFDRERYGRARMKANATQLAGSAKVTQLPTDFVLFPQHPYAAIHSVESRNGRWAKMLDYFARERIPFA